MAMRKLRVYTGPLNNDSNSCTLNNSTSVDSIKVTLGDILPILADAVASDRTWLTDFESDEITISTDLFDVLQAYSHFRRPGA